jgi:hypothetical protein
MSNNFSELFGSVREVNPREAKELLTAAQSSVRRGASLYLHPWSNQEGAECGVASVVRIDDYRLDDSVAWYVKVEGDVRLVELRPGEHRLVLLEAEVARGT